MHKLLKISRMRSLRSNAYQQVLDKDPNDLTALQGNRRGLSEYGQDRRGEGMADKGYWRSIRKTRLPIYTIGVIDWRLAYRNAIQTRTSLGLQDNGDPIKDKTACQKLAEQNGPIW